jgi:hypothetical protein
MSNIEHLIKAMWNLMDGGTSQDKNDLESALDAIITEKVNAILQERELDKFYGRKST